ncbi:hypothetical protein IFM89_027545 [Coptis chinensis]|uniref:Origin of replication complex subunit 4 n=1 Tax=Coptis chinensis TaxID=261450 RepID=A0A835HMM0_9MAGN|nr:hypothetical protein IFM89_027545 [Coptis chinensis]
MESQKTQKEVEKAQLHLRTKLCNRTSIFSSSPDSNFSKLKFIVSNSVTEGCNNSVLLLGPRGCGQIEVLDLVLGDLKAEYPDIISVVRLDGVLHYDDNCSLKASSDDNTQFLMAVLREYGLAHKTVVFVLDEFDLFTQGKQRLLYSLLDAMQSVTSQAVVIGSICGDERFVEILNTLSDADSSVHHLLNFLFLGVCNMNLEYGFLSVENFKTALLSIQRPYKLEILQGCSVLELYILACMKRLEDKEQNSYNFNSVMIEYKDIHDSYRISDYYAWNVFLRAFEHLLQRELISFTDNRGQNQSIEFRPVKLLISSQELHQGLKSYHSCPALLQKLMTGELNKMKAHLVDVGMTD